MVLGNGQADLPLLAKDIELHLGSRLGYYTDMIETQTDTQTRPYGRQVADQLLDAVSAFCAEHGRDPNLAQVTREQYNALRTYSATVYPGTCVSLPPLYGMVISVGDKLEVSFKDPLGC